MSDYDPDKTRFHSTEEGYNPGYVVGNFRKMVADLLDITDTIYHGKAMRMSKERYQNSKNYLLAYQKTILAYDDTKPPLGRLTPLQQQQILVMVDDVLKGKIEAVQFQLNRGCDGITEIFSSKQFSTTNEQDKL